MTSLGTNLGTVTELSSTGAMLSGPNGYTANGIVGPHGIAIDSSNNVWIADTSYVTELTSTGSPLSPACYYGTACGFQSENMIECLNSSIAIDSSGNAWSTQGAEGCTSVTELSTAGMVLSGPGGYVTTDMFQPYGLAFDGSGNAWMEDGDRNNVTELSSSGSPLSSTTQYLLPYIEYEGGLAIDNAGDVWVAGINGFGTSYLDKLANSGGSSNSYTGGGMDGAGAIAIDGAGDIWIVNQPNSLFNLGTLSEFASSGVPITGANGYNAGGLIPGADVIAIDGSGDVWVGNGTNFSGRGSVAEMIGAATPLVVPFVSALPKSPTLDGSSNLGTRP